MPKKVYIIAEIGNTHEGSLGLAKQFAKAAADCGVDAIKFQTHIFESESLLSAPNPPYFKDETRQQYFERTAFSQDQWRLLKIYCEIDLKVDFFSSPFSLEAVDLLEEIDVSTYKIASGEVSNIPLLIKIAQTGKKVLLSSGMSSYNELDLAVDTLKAHGAGPIILLQCTSEYPCPASESGLNVIGEFKSRYEGVEIGYSDHTFGVAVPLAAVVKGATVIEKHFTLSKKMYGSDAMNSTEPDEFKRLVNEIRNIEIALDSSVNKDDKACKLVEMKRIFEKSIVAARNIDKNQLISEDILAYKKPGDGIPAREYKRLIGKKINKNVNKDHLFSDEDFIA